MGEALDFLEQAANLLPFGGLPNVEDAPQLRDQPGFEFREPPIKRLVITLVVAGRALLDQHRKLEAVRHVPIGATTASEPLHQTNHHSELRTSAGALLVQGFHALQEPTVNLGGVSAWKLPLPAVLPGLCARAIEASSELMSEFVKKGGNDSP